MEPTGIVPSIKRRKLNDYPLNTTTNNTNNTTNIIISDVPTNKTLKCFLKLIIPYLTSIEYIQSLSLCSKYYYEYIKNDKNVDIILDILQQREFFNFGTNDTFLEIKSTQIYELIAVLHNLWKHQNDITIQNIWLKSPNIINNLYNNNSLGFIQRFSYHVIYENNIPNKYCLKYWIESISKTLSIEISNLYYHTMTKNFVDITDLSDINIYELRMQTDHLLIAMIRALQIPTNDCFKYVLPLNNTNNGQLIQINQRENILLYTHLINWCFDKYKFLPSPSEWLILINNFDNMQFTAFIIHCVCKYFELKTYGFDSYDLNIKNNSTTAQYVYYYQSELYHFINNFASKIRTDHIAYNQNKLIQFNEYFNTYNICQRFGIIWNKLQCMQWKQYIKPYINTPIWNTAANILNLLLYHNDINKYMNNNNNMQFTFPVNPPPIIYRNSSNITNISNITPISMPSNTPSSSETSIISNTNSDNLEFKSFLSTIPIVPGTMDITIPIVPFNKLGK